MANATYYGLKYFRDDNNNALQTVPLCRPGEVRVWQDTIGAFGGASDPLVTTDTIKAARMPKGHIPLIVQIATDGDLDTGANTLAVNVGITGDADRIAAGLVIGDANRVFVVPSNNGATTGNIDAFDTAAPTTDYDLLITPSVNATTGTTGAMHFRVFYTVNPAASSFDPSNSPSAVVGSQ